MTRIVLRYEPAPLLPTPVLVGRIAPTQKPGQTAIDVRVGLHARRRVVPGHLARTPGMTGPRNGEPPNAAERRP